MQWHCNQLCRQLQATEGVTLQYRASEFVHWPGKSVRKPSAVALKIRVFLKTNTVLNRKRVASEKYDISKPPFDSGTIGKNYISQTEIACNFQVFSCQDCPRAIPTLPLYCHHLKRILLVNMQLIKHWMHATVEFWTVENQYQSKLFSMRSLAAGSYTQSCALAHSSALIPLSHGRSNDI